jgi:hypothetical protein
MVLQMMMSRQIRKTLIQRKQMIGYIEMIHTILATLLMGVIKHPVITILLLKFGYAVLFID